MTPTELAELRAMSEWILGPSFYVEARVGSENHRGECCRALMNGGGRNEPADELLKRFARAFLSQRAELARLRKELASVDESCAAIVRHTTLAECDGCGCVSLSPAERAAYLARDYERLRAANAGLVKDLETIERERTDWKLCTDGNVERLQSMIRAALARHAATNLAAPPLVWSDAKPTVPGWYWRRDDINQEPCIGYYDPKNWFGTEWMRDLPGQFAGPIPPPAPTPTEDAPR